MFTCQIGKVPLKLWMSEQEFYSDAELQRQACAVSQHPFVFHHVAIMADGHPGFGMPIGGVAAFKGAVCPYGVGSHIGCGMKAVGTDIQADAIRGHDVRERIKTRVKELIPMGFSHYADDKHLKGYAETLHTVADDIPDEIGEIMPKSRILASLGSLGSGNHFFEFQEDETGMLWVMLHSGSRNLGAQVCKIHHDVAVGYCAKNGIALPCKELAVLPVTTTEGRRYLRAMSYCLQFAKDSRDLMMHNLLGILCDFLGKVEVKEDVHIHHNYAAPEDGHFGEVGVYVHRKGATDASLGRMGVIPGSMGTASFVVQGKGSADSFNSCSHGGGRRMSRGQAKRTITMSQFEAAMGSIVYDKEKSLLDESPDAYKDIKVVMANQTDLVEIRRTLKPLLAVKSTGCKEE